MVSPTIYFLKEVLEVEVNSKCKLQDIKNLQC